MHSIYYDLVILVPGSKETLSLMARGLRLESRAQFQHVVCSQDGVYRGCSKVSQELMWFTMKLCLRANACLFGCLFVSGDFGKDKVKVSLFLGILTLTQFLMLWGLCLKINTLKCDVKGAQHQNLGPRGVK